MGVSNGSDLIYTADKLSLSQLATIARARNNEHGKRIRPCIDIDANLLAHKLNGGKEDIVKELIAFATAVTKENLDVAIVCDGPVRDHSKRATTKRAAEREKFRLKALFSKLRLQQLRSQKQNPPENFDIAQANKDMVILEKTVKSSESRARTHVPPDFISRLSEAVSVEQTTRCDSDDTTSTGEISLHIAKFQADTVICYRLVHGHSHIAVTTDTDYQVIAGEHALLLRAWKFPAEKNKSRVRILSDLELACGFVRTMAKAAQQDSPYMTFTQEETRKESAFTK